MNLKERGMLLSQVVTSVRLISAISLIGILSAPLAHGATIRSPDIRFCGIGQNPNSPDVITFDLRNHRVVSSDAQNAFEVLENNVAIGITGELPIALPKTVRIGQDTATAWHLGAYNFSMTGANDGDPEWRLIFARPMSKSKNPPPKYVLSTLYSRSEGVIGLRQAFSLSENRTIVQKLFSCGKDSMTAALLKEYLTKSR